MTLIDTIKDRLDYPLAGLDVAIAALFAVILILSWHIANDSHRHADNLRPIEQEVKSMAISLCWRMGQRAVLSPPGADRPAIQCEEAAL